MIDVTNLPFFLFKRTSFQLNRTNTARHNSNSSHNINNSNKEFQNLSRTKSSIITNKTIIRWNPQEASLTLNFSNREKMSANAWWKCTPMRRLQHSRKEARIVLVSSLTAMTMTGCQMQLHQSMIDSWTLIKELDNFKSKAKRSLNLPRSTLILRNQARRMFHLQLIQARIKSAARPRKNPRI